MYYNIIECFTINDKVILIYQYNFLYGLDLYTVVAVFIVCTGI